LILNSNHQTEFTTEGSAVHTHTFASVRGGRPRASVDRLFAARSEGLEDF